MLEEESKDLTYDAYRDQYIGHIQGTAPNDREAHESVEERDDDAAGETKKSVM